MTKSKKNSRKKIFKQSRFNLIKYIKEAGRKLTHFECKSNVNQGLYRILVSRKRLNGDVLFGIFLVDTYCLGVKNTIINLVPEDKYREMLSQYDLGQLEPMDLNHAQNIIYGAVEYAEDLGFQPHKSFNIAEYILDPVESIEYEEIEFGQEGKPMYFAGPHDNAKKIYNQLVNSVGEGNFYYIMEESMFDDEYVYEDDEDDDFDNEDDYDEYDEIESK
jgi:hypothetical protein